MINQVYFVHENILSYNEFRNNEFWKESLKTFEDFDSYYSYLNGEIYENACYYQCDLSTIKRKVDISRLMEKKSFIEDSIDKYTLNPSEDEEIKYKKNEKNKDLCKKWIKKYKKVSSGDELMRIENDFKKSELYKNLTENTGFSFDMYNDFMLWNYIYDAQKDVLKFNTLMEYMSNYTCAGTLVREICGIFNPKDIVKKYNYTDSTPKVIHIQKKRLRDIAEAFENKRVESNISAFFDEKTHYYCEKTTYILKDEKLRNSEGMREFSNYRFFETFEEFIEYRNGDLTKTDLIGDIWLKYDFSNCKTDEKTKLPIGNTVDFEYVIKKEYSDGNFIVSQVWYNQNNVPLKQYIHKFIYFFDFVAYLKGDLSGADLILCDGLKNLKDISAIDFTDARITSGICDKFGIKYKSYAIDSKTVESFAETEEYEKSTALVLQSSRELTISEKGSVLEMSGYDKTKQRVSYVSDLHLMHKLEYFEPKSRVDVEYVIQNMLNTIVSETENILLIGGDTSSDYTIFEMFIRMLRDELDRKNKNTKVIFVLGNHELWESPTFAFDEIVDKYEKIITECGMYLLQNNILYMNSKRDMYRITNAELSTSSDKEIREKLREAQIIFFGGLAFSGYNEEFNANNGIYRATISRNEEIKQSRIFEELYKKVLTTLSDRKLVIFTHTPMDCWSEKVDYHKDFVYVSGHTHKNLFYDDGEVRIYADNQIGYTNNNPHLKWFELDNEYDYFSDYEDGIYKISADEYRRFYRGKNISITFNREVNVLYMLKKNGYYCFIHESKRGSLTILNGGALKKLNEYDINYYFNNMDAVIAIIRKPLDKYMSIQEKIAFEIRKLGGAGTIHGCIIDIDWYNHVYVNPVDMKITGYWASNIIDKKIYPNVPALLEKNCPAMYANYIKQLRGSSKNLPMLSKGAGKKLSVFPQTYLDTDIYKASREIKKMQKLTSNILTSWYEFDNGHKMIESKKK